MRTGDGAHPGALVLSLDFELHWGVRDHVSLDDPYVANLRGARTAVPAMLDAFARHGIACTWATVGFLFARDRAELATLKPRRRPAYVDQRLDPYREHVGDDEASDPLHFAASLVDRIRATARQEVATHTYSHYYCLERGQSRETFADDLAAATAAAALRGVRLRSIVYPRNQRNPAYDDLLRDAGIVAFRGQPPGWANAPRAQASLGLVRRGVRYLEARAPVGPAHLLDWEQVVEPSGLCDVRASCFLRPIDVRLGPIESWRVARLQRAIVSAARSGKIVHLWWHPHNFGVGTAAQMAMLERLLETYAECRARYGMLSLSMADVADAALADRAIARSAS